MKDDTCKDICPVIPECFTDNPKCELKRLFRESAFLLDDLVYCVENPGKDPCEGRRKSKRTRQSTIDEAITSRDILLVRGGKRRK